jgi:NADH-quinone oxidoreductase subunit L
MLYGLLLPFIGSFITGLFLRNQKNAAIFTTTFSVLIAFISSCFIFYNIGFSEGKVMEVVLMQFISMGSFSSFWAIHVDGLTAIMLIVVTFVSLLVHVYSIGYMSHDENVPKFMSFLSLFTFFMLVLITAQDFLQLFVGWEGVGLCSYLLIGFWNEKPSANNAAIKAFITNRVGDLALILGMCAIYYIFGSLNFKVINENINNALVNVSLFGVEVSAVTLIAVLLFIGCMGKSAQLFLHVWLPDAMEGPTPVSALIHAATMVTAGVFLLSRVSIIFEYSETARMLIIIVGSLTSLFAATIALSQNDIKKIIAYSTCSQLGYMFVASGFSAYNAGIFHLATHAFFKALLFLSAGSVIHAMSGEQDINKMGALSKKIPITFVCMLIGSIAIAGLPPLSGFFSKDAILESAFMADSAIGMFAFVIGVVTAFLTTFYSWRLLILVFNGSKTRNTKEVVSHIHESPASMIVPLVCLSVFAIFAGGILEYIFHILSVNAGFLGSAINVLPINDVLSKIHDTPIFIKFLPTVLSIISICLAYYFFLSSKKYSLVPAGLKKLVENKYYVDEIYGKIFIAPTKQLSKFFMETFDKKIVDAFFVAIPTNVFRFFSKITAVLQNGKINFYFLSMLASICLIFYFLVLKTYTLL